jgi:hypothetical protein
MLLRLVRALESGVPSSQLLSNFRSFPPFSKALLCVNVAVVYILSIATGFVPEFPLSQGLHTHTVPFPRVGVLEEVTTFLGLSDLQ